MPKLEQAIDLPDHSRYSTAFRWFAHAWIAWLIVVELLAIGEVAWSKGTHGLDIGLPMAIAIACINGAIGWLLLSPWNFLLFILAWAASPRFAKSLLIALILIQLLAHLALMNYFSTALVPLGADLYGYSWKDIRQTVGAAGGIPWQFIVLLLTVIALQWLLFRISLKTPKAPSIVAPAIAGAGIILLFLNLPDINTKTSEFTRSLLTDKLNFFIDRSWEHFFQKNDGTDIYADNYLPDEHTPGNYLVRHYIDETSYPFLYKDSTVDVLSPFLRKDERPPNIVLLIVEGLGSAFSNEQAYLGSFTPFLDSLSRKSLYWDNFLSEGGRTFAVLPSILGSLPFAKNGFLGLENEMPSHYSLINLLKANGYHTSFYYGGDAHFDNMDIFLRKTGIDELNDGSAFPPGYTKIPSSNGFTWGYNDRELFRRWMDSRPQDAAKPQLSVILTVSMHSPFLLNEPGEYNRRFESRMTQLGFTQDEIQAHRNYKDQYASILYTDQAIRDFLNACAERKDYAHTIFLITGDHRMPEIPMRDKIDRFHVPFIVYSPLLSRHTQFSSVSTHFDITPSLLAYLGHSYGSQLPANVTWMGDGLDTARTFRNIHSYPLMQTKTDLVDYIKGDKHFNNGAVFQLKPGLREETMADDNLRQQLSSAMDAFRQRNDRWLQAKALLPDSIARLIPR